MQNSTIVASQSTTINSNAIITMDVQDALDMIDNICSTLALADYGIQGMIEKDPFDEKLKGISQAVVGAKVDLDYVSDFCWRVREFLEGSTATFEAMTKHYHTQYADISSDPDKHFALNRIKNEIHAAHPELSPIQLVDQAAAQVYAKFGGKQQSVVDDKAVRILNLEDAKEMAADANNGLAMVVSALQSMRDKPDSDFETILQGAIDHLMLLREDQLRSVCDKIESTIGEAGS